MVFLFLWFSQLYLPVREILKVKEGKRGKMRREKKGYELCGFLFIERAFWVLNQGGQGLNVALVKQF
jgi:hypothetical protein